MGSLLTTLWHMHANLLALYQTAQSAHALVGTSCSKESPLRSYLPNVTLDVSVGGQSLVLFGNSGLPSEFEGNYPQVGLSRHLCWQKNFLTDAGYSPSLPRL